jgi:hypothetical protein
MNAEWVWWKFEDVKSIFHINAKKSIPYKDFLLANVDWSEWPGGAAEIESAFNTQYQRVKQLEKALTDAGIEIPSWDDLKYDEEDENGNDSR